MSFIEKNKAWLLPLLGLGILGVGYMNYRTLSGGPPAEAPVPSPPPAPPPAEAGGPATEPAENAEDLWSDLRPFAVLPAGLDQEGALRDRARLALGAEVEPEAPLSLGKPGWAALAPSGPRAPGSSAETDAGPLPTLEFLIHGPQGSSAWFGGRPFQPGERVLDSGYTLGRIGPTFVELTGPQGRRVESTLSIPTVASHTAEAP